MNIKVLKVGYLKCNCYILEDKKKVLIVDPGDEYEVIKKEIKEKEVVGILITHSHFDHVGCVKDIVNDYHVKVYSYDNLKEEDYDIDNFKFKVIYTPGHSEDSITFYFKEDSIMFTGDFLFYDTIGRCDLEGSDYSKMLQSIEKIKQYNQDITIYPGHGINSTLRREFRENIYLN